MGKDNGKNGEKPSSAYGPEQEKRSFWTRFFEPVPEDADSPSAYPEDGDAFLDEDGEGSYPEEAEDDGETVLLGAYGEEGEPAQPDWIQPEPPQIEAAQPERMAPEPAQTPRQAPPPRLAPPPRVIGSGNTGRIVREGVEEGPDAETTPGYRPLTSRLEKQPLPPAFPEEPTPAQWEFDPYTGQPLHPGLSTPDMPPVDVPPIDAPVTFAPDGYDGSTEQAGDVPEAAPSSYAASFLTGAAAGAGIDDFTEAERQEAQRPRAPGQPQAPVRLFEDEGTGSNGAPENIRLFDDEEDTTARRKMGETTRTHMFRTGTSSTTRIHLNETEELLRAEETEQRIREREAKARREARREKENKRKQRQQVVKKIFSNIAFILFFLAAVIVALYYGFLLSDVTVLGNDKYTSDYIVQMSGLEKGTHMLFCDLDKAKESIQTDPYLQVDQITYIFPNRIRIVITERKEVAGIIGLDYNVIIDDQGYVLSMSGGTDLTGLLQVTGVSMTGFQLGQRLGEGNDFTTATLVTLIDKLEEYNLLTSITSVDLTTPLAITMTAKNGLSIHLGQSTDMDTKMQMLFRLLPNFTTRHNISTGTLYLSAKGGAVYSPTNAEANAVAAAENAQNMTGYTGGDAVPYVDPNYVDEDGDGLDDVTGLPQATPLPITTPAPTQNLPGGSSDAFSG